MVYRKNSEQQFVLALPKKLGGGGSVIVFEQVQAEKNKALSKFFKYLRIRLLEIVSSISIDKAMTSTRKSCFKIAYSSGICKDRERAYIR